ncbi:MAG: aminotransferase class V-fold PLP-dependent enzyme [Lautropia sp.]
MALMPRDAQAPGSPLDAAATLDRIRRDTPGVQHRVHLNNAGAGLMPSGVLAVMQEHLELEANIGAYEAADRAGDAMAAVYASVARLIRADRGEIALLPNATMAWQMAFYALPFGAGDRILTARTEYAANLVAYAQVARRTGARVEIIPDDEAGETDPQALATMLDDRVKLVAMSWIPSNGGLVNPVAEIGALTQRHGIPFLVDACQAAGHLDIDVDAIGCDMLTAAGRKFLRGPRGTGFLYVRRGLLETLEPPMIDHFGAPWVSDGYRLRDDARRFETWERNVAAQLGLGAAVDYALALGPQRIEARCRKLAARLRTALEGVPGLTLRDLGSDRSAIVSATLRDLDPAFVRDTLYRQGINVHVSKPASTPVDARDRALPPLLRLSPHYYNTEAEIDRFVAALTALCACRAGAGR